MAALEALFSQKGALRSRKAADDENVVVPARRHADLALHPMTIETVTHRIAQPDPEWRSLDI